MSPVGTGLLARHAPTALRGLVLALAGLGLGFGVHAARPSGLSLAHFEEPTQCDGNEGQPSGPTEVDPTAASQLCGRDDVVIADARPAPEYAEGHVAGAVHLPCTASGAAAEDALSHLGGAQTIIVYGRSTDEAVPVAQSLRRRHHGDVRVLLGGFPAWASAGLACASGPCDRCKETGESPTQSPPRSAPNAASKSP